MRNSDEISRNEKILLEFLAQHPDMFVSRKKIKANPQSTLGQSEILQKIRDAKDKKVIPSQPSTVPDQAVSVILGAWYGIEEGKWEQVKREHQYSMVAENLVGEFLERYIEQDHSAEKIVAAGFDAETVFQVVRMVDRNEYKRRQAPIGVRISRKAFGRDRRYPVTNGWQPGN